MFARPVQRLATSSTEATASAPTASGLGTTSAAPVIAHSIGTTLPVAPPERPNRTGLPDDLKRGVETLSGIALDDVHVHRNSAQPGALGAHAYAQGSHIHVAPGQDHNLPHEAWHVVQQKQGRVRATMQLKGGVAVNDDAALEREADVMGARATGLRFAGLPSFDMPSTDGKGVVAVGITQRMMGEDEDDPSASESAAVPIAASSSANAGIRADGNDSEYASEEDEREEKHAASSSYQSDDHAASLPSSAASSSGSDRIFPNLSRVEPSSDKHHYDNMHKNWEEQLKKGRFSFVRPETERGHIDAINQYIGSIKAPGSEASPAVTHETFLEPKRDRKTGQNIKDPQTKEDKLFVRHEFMVAGNLYSTHLDTAQLYPVAGPDIFHGTGAADMRNIVTANAGIPSSNKIKKALAKMGLPIGG